MNSLLSFVLASITAFSIAPVGAQTNQLKEVGVKAADPRVRNALEQSKVPYTIDDDGDFVVNLKVGKSGRTQVAYISSKTQTPETIEWREIYSYGLRIDGPIDLKTAQYLLKRNSQTVLGAWEFVQNQDKPSYAVYSIKIPADASPETVVDAVDAALALADDLENKFSGKDRF